MRYGSIVWRMTQVLRVRQLFEKASKEKFDDVAKNKLVEGLTLLAHYHKLFPDSYLSCVALQQNEKMTRRVREVETDRGAQGDALRKLAEFHIEQSLVPKTHKERRKTIETALKLLINSAEQVKSPETMSLVARAYYLRSLIIRPKGFTVPAKKTTALKQARKWAEDARDSDDSLKEAHRVRGMVALELEKIRQIKTKDLVKILEDAMLCLLTDDMDFDVTNEHIAEDIAIVTRHIELKGDIFVMSPKILDAALEGISFQKARAACVAGNNVIARKFFADHCEFLKRRPFLDPLWGETVSFLLRLKCDVNNTWKEFALQVWESCQVQERYAKNPHLRWYWSGLQELYDLAFLAAEDSQKAKIADSLKSRIPLKWKAMETIDKKEVEVYESALLGRYIKGYTGRESDGDGKQLTQPKSLSFDVPEKWTAVHFYLSGLAGKGYAVIKHGGNSNGWETKSFKIDRLFAEYLSWQSAYTAYANGADKSLVALCRTIGEEMNFLFDLPKEPEKILFIPHGFLHRLPLHAGINEDDKLLLEEHLCAYLPAWSFTASGASPEPATGPDEVVSFLESADSGTIDNLLKPKSSQPPRSFTINCHGLADAVNPFGARLILKDGEATLRQLLDSSRNLQGSRVFLGACETDMVPPPLVTLDEHLSLSSVFLIKGAREVAGALYEASDDTIKKIQEILPPDSDTSLEAITGFQRKGAEKWRKSCCNNSLPIYDSIFFRVFVSKLL